ncbi:hypothetical protein SOVF_057790 [Spinacia oleracea]|nr:hypothetical protein SOVF_057790 [Spinacia oleracea]
MIDSVQILIWLHRQAKAGFQYVKCRFYFCPKKEDRMIFGLLQICNGWLSAFHRIPGLLWLKVTQPLNPAPPISLDGDGKVQNGEFASQTGE